MLGRAALWGPAAVCAGGRRPARSPLALHVVAVWHRLICGCSVETGVRFPPSPQRGAAGVPGAGGPVCGAGLLCGARPLCVPVGGGPPARSPHASCARSGRSRGPPWPCRHPPALRQMPPAPSTPVGPGVLTCGSVRWVEAQRGPDTARGHCSRSLRRPPHLWGRVAVLAQPGPATAHGHRSRASPPLVPRGVFRQSADPFGE